MADDSPPPSPPSPANSDTDTKSSRKREREVSLEPGTSTPISTSDIRAPAKKNRRELDSTVEEDGQSLSRSPSPGAGVSASPPQEMKIRVRQISQGVEELRWQQRHSPEHNNEVDTNDADAAPDSTELEPEDIKVDGAVDSEDGGEKEKGLKRKYLERGTSAEPAGPQQDPGEALKRPRDDPDEDENPRETKRPSPPPEAPPAAPKLSGFTAYASSSSPFAAVKGENLFKKAPSPSPFAAVTPSVVASTSTRIISGQSSPTLPFSTTTPKRTPVFGSPSPFGASAKAKQDVLGLTSKLVRAKSPVRRAAADAGSSAFSAYVSKGAQAFALAESKPVLALVNGNGVKSDDSKSGSGSGSGVEDGEDGETEPNSRAATFGEKLRASKDGDDKEEEDTDSDRMVFNEQEVTTGEEDEETVHQVRGKLFVLLDGQWKERGTGMLKINVRRSDGGGARLVMRKEAVYAVLLNVTLFHGMQCVIAQDPRYLRLSFLEAGQATHYNLRVGSAKAAQDLLNEINANVPPA
ncbi:hypothetical protein C8F01DRAFT_577251 [Mycena amicta]|nr:hypothetical protein C8F01DRAFT_577251 [Mycena amicta]